MKNLDHARFQEKRALTKFVYNDANSEKGFTAKHIYYSCLCLAYYDIRGYFPESI